ncbi:hypothetical protein [uncultured Draconibacterium sp.]|uniref:hypothetical protein n=1 Tax=uncultured Draconibacterium sp. TaxID=1573823 RepID=UPI002630C4F8|nr:hypothetical protein [uncultured Draconibacterium sp.]
MKKLLALFLFIFSLSCSNEDETVTLDVSSIKLMDVGQITYDYSFDATFVGDSTCECKIRTINIKKGDTIASLDAFVKGSELFIDIISSPYDFDCNLDSCLTVHDLYFNLNLLNQKEYYVTLSINNGIVENGNLHEFN